MSGPRWNDETQSWEAGEAGPATPPPPPLHAPGTGGGPVAPPPPPPLYVPEAGGGPVAPPSPMYAPEAGGGPVAPPSSPPVYAPETGDGPVAPPSPPPVYVPETGDWQYPAAPVPAPRPRSRAVLAAGVAVAVLAAGSVGAWMVWGGGKNGKDPVAGPPASVSSTPTSEPPSSEPPSASPSDTSTPMDDIPPPGYHGVEDPQGFTIAVPEGWNRTESDQGVFYNAPDGLSLVQVFVVKEAGLTPYEALRGASEDGRANKPGYEELSLERVTGEPGAPADSAELVYAYDRAGGRRKVVDRAFTGPDGTHYAILAAGPETSWPKQREILRVALDYFHPATP